MSVPPHMCDDGNAEAGGETNYLKDLYKSYIPKKVKRASSSSTASSSPANSTPSPTSASNLDEDEEKAEAEEASEEG